MHSVIAGRRVDYYDDDADSPLHSADKREERGLGIAPAMPSGRGDEF